MLALNGSTKLEPMPSSNMPKVASVLLLCYALPIFGMAAKSPLPVLDFSYNPTSDSGTSASLDLDMGCLIYKIQI